MLSLQGVGKIYTHQKTPTTALSQIQLTLENYQTIGILGKAKAGKTTLLRCITMIDPPTSGSIVFEEVNLTQMKKNAIRAFQQQFMGYISSPEQLLASQTVFDNVALSLICAKMPKKEITKMVWPLLEMAELQDKAHLYPSQLNIRQKQRVAIARALVRQPKLVLWDNAAAWLDLYSTQNCMNMLLELQQYYRFSLILMSETLEVIKPICHQIAILHQGSIIENAPVVELLSHPHSALTKEFIRNSARSELPPNLRRQIQSRAHPSASPLFKMTFHEHLDHEPVLTYLIRTFNLVINILHASLETLSQGHLGVLVAEITGSTYNIDQAMHYLETQQIYTERLGYVTRNT